MRVRFIWYRDILYRVTKKFDGTFHVCLNWYSEGIWYLDNFSYNLIRMNARVDPKFSTPGVHGAIRPRQSYTPGCTKQAENILNTMLRWYNMQISSMFHIVYCFFVRVLLLLFCNKFACGFMCQHLSYLMIASADIPALLILIHQQKLCCLQL